MSRSRTFATLSSCERQLAVRAVVLLWFVRLGSWVLPFRTVRAWLPMLARVRHLWGRDCELSAERVGWAVATMSRYVPAATCLVRAMVADRLLVELGFPSEIRLGVVKDEHGRMQAHAWVESGAQVVIGGAEAERFRPLRSLDLP